MSTAEQTINPLPSAGESFYTALQTFLNQEDADRYALLFSDFVQAGGTHGTAAGLVGTPAALVAFAAGFYVTESGSITYPDNDITFVIANSAITGNSGTYTRVAGTHYLIDAASASEPVLPAGAVRLMTVTTAGGAITAVTDRRTRSPLPSSIFVNIESFGASAAASAAVNRAAIQAAHDALPASGGTIIVPNAIYQTDGTTITISKPVNIEGQGSPGFASATPGPTIQTTSGTANTFTVTTTNGAAVMFRNLCFQTSVLRTAGASILIAVAGGIANRGSLVEHCVFDAPFNGIVATSASDLTVRNCLFGTVRSIAVQVENQTATTTGGYLVQGCTIQSTTGTAVGVRMLSGGDLRVNGCTFTGAFNIGIETNIATGIAASGLTVIGCRLSGQSSGIALNRTGTGTLKKITITGNNISSVTAAINVIALGTTSGAVTGNYLDTTGAASTTITMVGAVDFVFVGNQINDASGGTATAFTLNASCERITIGSNMLDGFITTKFFAISGSAINIIVSGVNASLNSILAADLPVAEQGSMLYCADCKRTGDGGFAAGTCVTGGSGNMAVRIGTLWKCQATN